MLAFHWSTALIITIIALLCFVLCYLKARLLERKTSLHSQPSYYAWWGLLLVLLTGFSTYLMWQSVANFYLTYRAKQELSLHVSSVQSTQQLSARIAVMKDMLKHGDLLNAVRIPGSAEAANKPNQLYKTISDYYADRGVNLPLDGDDLTANLALKYQLLGRQIRAVGGVCSIIIAFLSGCYALWQTRVAFRARKKVEAIIVLALQATAAIAILTTIAIVLSLLFQTISFFKTVPISEFLFGTVWDPRFAAAGAEHSAGQFGLLPLLCGTLYIAFVAMLVAVPVGLFAAIYMSEYATSSIRSIVKPMLEVLAGIPTIVYGFFAAFTVGPFLRDLSAMLNGGQPFILAQSVFTAGLVIGIMLIPFVSSLSDDILTAVPKALRDCSYGLGATKSETIKKVVLPAALPGIVGALLLSASRAIGETMIVVLAAGVTANLTLNPFQAMTTITVKIVSQLTGDLEFNSPQTLVAFALGMMLFLFTLLMNIFALYIVRKYREQYE